MAGKACVLDSSVAVKWFANEHDSDDAVQLLKTIREKGVQVILPDLILYELANALRWNKNFNQDDVQEALKAFASFGFQLQAPTFELLKEAIRIAYSSRRTVYDAIFLALAHEYGCPFITADQKFAQQVKEAVALKDALNLF